MSQFLPTLPPKIRREVARQVNGLLSEAGLTAHDIIKSSKRYDAGANKTIVRLKFRNVPAEVGDLLLEVPGKH